MTLSHLCIACQHGHHEAHRDVVHASVPGLIGSGWTCPCRGGCLNARERALRIAQAPEPGSLRFARAVHIVWSGEYDDLTAEQARELADGTEPLKGFKDAG